MKTGWMMVLVLGGGGWFGDGFGRYYVIRKGQEWKETKRGQQSFQLSMSNWPRSRVKATTDGHEGESVPGGDKAITETLDFEPHWWRSPLP
jgi:hypothetical protein